MFSDNAVCCMVLQTEDRFVNTLKQILKSPERGGLTTNVPSVDIRTGHCCVNTICL